MERSQSCRGAGRDDAAVDGKPESGIQPFQELFEDRGLAEKSRVHASDGGPCCLLRNSAARGDRLGGFCGGRGQWGHDSGGRRERRGGEEASGEGWQVTVPVTIFELLRAPALASPGSLPGQLARIRKIWKPLLGPSMEKGLAVAAEVLREEELSLWRRFHRRRRRGRWE